MTWKCAVHRCAFRRRQRGRGLQSQAAKRDRTASASLAGTSRTWATTSARTRTSRHPTYTPPPRQWRGSTTLSRSCIPGVNNLPVVTGKPLEIGGSLGRHEATGRGCLYATETPAGARHRVRPDAVTRRTRRSAGIRRRGSVAARLFHQAGATIIAVSDSRGGIHSAQGIDREGGRSPQGQARTVVGLPGTHGITNEELLELDCDILIPAAMENQIRRDNAPRRSRPA